MGVMQYQSDFGVEGGNAMRLSAIKNSPAAQIPADQTSNSDVMQKKLIDCPISNQDPCNLIIFETRRMKERAWLILTCVCHIEEKRQCHSWNDAHISNCSDGMR